MPQIRKLPVGLVNKIAAGEVIERPASVVKELLENSIDAGATQVEIAIDGGGTDLIRITDNGCGIEPDQLELALAPHATSKLVSSDDLFDVRTLGFRGEALASIAEVSHLTLRSRTASSDSGYELRCEGGTLEPIKPCAMNVGTSIEVRHLFFNTPVRRKFLKAPQTEMAHVVDAFARIALAFPNVHMILTSNDRVLHDLPPTERRVERIRAFYGDEVGDALIPVEHADEHVRIRGYVADPSVSRTNNRLQFLFLNGRYIRDRSLQHALGEAYRGLLMVGRLPICFLQLELDPKVIDVNVHPTKIEVRFADSGAIYSRLLNTLRHKFLSTDLVAKAAVPDREPAALVGAGAATIEPVDRSGSGTELMTWARQQSHALPAARDIHFDPVDPRRVPDFRPFPNFGGRTDPFVDPAGPASTAAVAPSSTMGSQATGPDPLLGHSVTTGCQILQTYLITEDEDGMVIIDQHALHERILFEQIKAKFLSKSLERQRLLVPETVHLAPSEAAVAIEAKEMLSEIGIEIEPFGGDTVLISSYPSLLAKMSPAEMLKQILDALINGGKKVNPQDLLDDIMNMMACKAAVKAGDRLSPQEISALLEQRHLYRDTHHCPHGRPTALVFSRQQLDKMFKRI
ncbi:MAG: DNA mismatch repair endonuclease MutL [Planctomycetota bacterium]